MFSPLVTCRLLTRPAVRCILSLASCSTETGSAQKKFDKLFKSVELEVRGHDKIVLQSYTSFVKTACNHLKIDSSPVERFPYVRWVQYALRAKFAKKKYKLHYETRTHTSKVSVYNVTGSTASAFLEYVQRNIPEGVAMKVTYEELCFLPDTIRTRPIVP